MDLLKKLSLLTSIVVLSFGALTAEARTPAETRLTNTATLTHSGGVVTDTVSVVVELVTAAVVVDTFPTGQSVGEGAALSVTYRVHSNANGDDQYFITATPDDQVQILGGVGGTYAGSVPFISLGASAVLTVMNATTFTIPGNDNFDTAGGAPNDIVNGLAAGDDVFIEGMLYRIASILETATSATITLEPNDIEDTPAATDISGLTFGDGVYESQEFDIFTADVGDIDTGFLAGNYNVDTQITNGSEPIISSFNVALVKTKIDKYVRCLTLCSETGAAVISYDGTTTEGAAGAGGGLNDFYDDGTRPQPNGTVEYLVRLENTGTSPLTSASLADTLPDFSLYVEDTLLMNGVADAADAGVFPLTLGLDVGAVAGTIAAAEVIFVTYTVQLTP